MGSKKDRKKLLPFFSSIFEAQAVDLAAGGMDLVVIVAVELVAQDTAHIVQRVGF